MGKTQEERGNDRKINVLHMVSWYYSVTEKSPVASFHTELCLGLSKYCNVAIYYPYERNLNDEFCVRDEFGIPTYRSKYRLEDKIRNRLYMYRCMKKIIAEFRPDIIHGHVGTEAGRFATMFGRIFRIPVIITEHSSAKLSGVDSFPHNQYAWLTYRLSRRNICVSDALTQDLKKIFPRYRFETIYNGIIIPDDIDEYIKNSVNYYLEGAVNAVMVAGMYDMYIKGVHMVIPVLKRLKDEGYNIVLHFVGDGEYRNAFEQMVIDNSIKDICIFHGWMDRKDVLTIVKQMDFLVSASRYESFGCNMAEAVMMGTPVLATDSGGSKSIVNESNGIMINEYSEDAIYEGFKKMISSFNSYDSNSMTVEARKKFSIDHEALAYMDIYKSIIAG